MNKAVTLTKRETQMAELLAWGLAKKEIADRLYVSTRTVEATIRNIYDKIGIQKATELCVWWFTTQCGVPMSLSPLKRGFVAMCLLAIIITAEACNMGNTMIRPVRTSVRTVRGQRSRRKEDYYYGC